MLSTQNRQQLKYLGAGLLTGALMLRVVFVSAGLKHLGVNADEALTFLQAREISNGGLSLFFWTQPYQFPFEAYLLSPFVDFLPWNAFGVRVLQLSLCLIAVAGFLAIYRLIGNWRCTWPGMLLILFPSAYWLTRQAGLMTPQHAMTVTFAWLLPLFFGLSRAGGSPHKWILAGGICSGLALSNHLLSLSLVAMAAAGFCLGRNRREAFRNSLYFIPGFLLGLSPYLYAKFFIPGAYQRVAESVAFNEAWGRVWNPVITKFVPLVLGIVPTYIPDSDDRITTFEWLEQPAAWFFGCMLILLTAVRARKFILRIRLNRWPSLELNDIFIGTTLCALALLALTGMDLRTRYALPIVWCFPFLLSYAYTVLPRSGRIFIGSVSLLLVIVNISGAAAIIEVWRKPGFSERHAVLPDLNPLYRYFEKHGITHCYSGWWLSYRIIFDSKEKIICSPPFNDRFRGWPQPFYKKLVDREANIAYVEGTYSHSLLRTHAFTNYLLHHRIEADRERIGEFVTYRNFRHRDIAGASVALEPGRIVIETGDNSEDAHKLVDGLLATSWSSVVAQQAGMFVLTAWDRPAPVHALQVSTTDKLYESEPPRLKIEGRNSDGSWQLLISDSVGHPHLIRLAKNIEPEFFDGLELMLGFEPIETTALRISVERPQPNHPWNIAELRILTEEPLPPRPPLGAE